MRLVGALVGGLLLSWLVALPAVAAGGFGELSVVGAGPVTQPTAALDAQGHGALAWVDGARVHVARHAPGGAWTPQAFPRRGKVRDVDLLITRGGDTIVTWAAGRVDGRSSSGVLAAIARRGRAFGRPQVIAAGRRAFGAAPRMAALADGRVVLVWRATRRARFFPIPGELRLAVRRPGRSFSCSLSLRRDGASPAIVGTSGGGALVAWSWPTRPNASRVLRAARLSPRDLRLGRSFQLSAAAVAGARLAAGPGNVVIASWLSRRRPAGVLAARLLPTRGPVRVLAPGLPHRETATIVFGPGGATLAAFQDSLPEPGDITGIGPDGIGPWVANGSATGEFADPVAVTPSGPGDVSTPLPALLPTGEALVVWSRTRAVPGRPKFDVVMARRPAGSSAFTGIETLGPGSGLTWHKPRDASSSHGLPPDPAAG